MGVLERTLARGLRIAVRLCFDLPPDFVSIRIGSFDDGKGVAAISDRSVYRLERNDDGQAERDASLVGK
jgi:hypothetical protein